MTTNSWRFLINQFLVATRTNYKKAFLLSNYHYAALLQAVKDNPGDPDYSFLLDRYSPAHLGFANAYTAWESAGGNRQSETLNVTQLIDTMTFQLDEWEPDILKAHKRKTPGYKKIFPDERKPFYRGGIDERIGAVKTLAENIGDDAALKDVRKNVLDFWQLLNTARTVQDGSKMAKDNRSSGVEEARIIIMQLQYAGTGFLINKFYQTPDKIAMFFDLTLLRDIEQTLFTGTLKAHSQKNVFVRTLLPEDSLRLKNNSTFSYGVRLSNTAEAMNGTVITVMPGEEKTVPVPDFGVTDYSLFRYLNAENTNDGEASFEIEIE